MKVLVIGNGAREHTLVWKIAQSSKVNDIFAAPGNAGTATIAHNLNVRSDDIESIARVAQEIGIDLTIVGPEVPLAAGIVDHFQRLEMPIFGSTKAASQIESSKVFSKKLMQKYAIPCPDGDTFYDYSKAIDYVTSQSVPIVIKADGLAAGKGVIIAESKDEAVKAVSDIMKAKVFGSAGSSVVIEECLTGREVSLLAFTDGKTVIPLTPACDYKRVFDNDQGLNTGGMGSYSPPGFFGAKLIKQVTETIIEPAVRAMAKEGISYRGILYAGLIMASDGPKVLEFNARFGDPETQVILPRLKTDLIEIMLAIIENRLDEIDIEWSDDACVGVVMASDGYPGSYETGFAIEGLDKLDEGILVFHAGTRQGENSQILTSGGRVITVTSTGKNIADARAKVYANLPRIHFKGCHYRKDIAAREVN